MRFCINMIFSLIIVLLINSCKNQVIKNTQLIHDVSKIYEKNKSVCFDLGEFENEILLIQVEKENLLLSDGFLELDSVFMHPKVFKGDKMIYTDDTRRIYSLKNEDIILTSDVFNTKYLILKEIDVLFQNKLCIIGINNNEVFVSFGLSEYIEDIDNDGFIEVGGFGFIEGYCTNCDSGYYNPAKIYELNQRVVFDTLTAKSLTMKKYEVFLGFESVYKPIKLLKNPPAERK